MTDSFELEDKTRGELQYSSGDNEDDAITGQSDRAASPASPDSEEQKKQTAPLWKIFRYASFFDVVRIILGSILSVIAGTALPFVFVILGLVISAFADFVIADTILSSLEVLYNTTDIDTSLLTNATFNHFCGEVLTAESGFTDYLLSDDPNSLLQNKLYTLSYGIVGISIAHLLGVLLSTILWSQTAINQEKRIKSKFIRAILNQDISHYDLRPSTELSVHLIDDIKSIKQGINSACSEAMFQLGSALSSFVLAYYFDWRLSLVATSIIVVLLTLLGVFGTVVGVATVKEQAFLTLASSWGEQVLSSIKTVIAYGGQNSELKRYGDFLRKAHSYSVLKSFSTAILYVFYHTFLHLIFTICLWYGGELFVSCSEITVGEIVSVIFLTTQVCISIGYLVLPLTTLSESAVAAANIFSVIDREPEIVGRNDANKDTLSSFEGSIRLSDVVFSYPSRPDVCVLHGIDLHIKPGQTVALVGPSGCGKSTIMKLIPRIYNTDGGTVLLDECNIRELSVKWLRNQIGIVSQEPALFNISIAENIGYGKEGATIEEIEAAAKAGNAHDFIMELPNGYDTIVGEGGSQISGGQKQRIAIARALVRDPKILLLDEATSALDTKSEKLVQQALDKASKGRTTIIIAHRLSTIRTADVIVGIDKGRVVEMGSHSELMEKQGLYYKLVVNQTNEEAEEDDEKKEFTKSFRRSTLRRQSSKQVIRKGPVRLKSRPESLFSRRGSSNLVPPVLSKRQSSSIMMSDTVFNISEDANEDGAEDVFNQEPVFQLDGLHQKASLADIFKLVKQDWWLLVIGLLACGLVGVAASSNYILMSRAIDVFTDTDPNELTSRLQVFVLWYAFLAVVGGIIYFIGIFFMGFAADKLSKRIKIKSFQKILDQDVAFFDMEENSLGDLVLYLVDDPGNINQITGLPLGFLSRVVFAAVASLVVSLYASWAIAFILLPAYPIIIIGFILELYAGKKFSEKASYSDSNRLAVETIENLPTVAALGIDERVARKFEDLLAKPAKYTLIGSTVHAFIYSFSQSSVIFATAAALSVSGHLLDVIVADAPYSSAISSLLLTSLLFRDAFNSIPDFQNARVSASRISDLLSQQSDISVNDNDGLIIESLSADISAKSLFFSYPSRPQTSILNGLDVKVKPGQTLALVGPSGSGKSTIISLLERFYDPSFGDLQLDGKDVRDLNIAWLRQQISLVSQEPVLFDMSIADNIRYGANFREEVTDEEIQEAAKSANIHNFILTLPEGYNTVVGLKGTQLSGGQKQRVAIARALVRNPKILLLDEATSALDTESERIVQEALDKAREGRTTVIIAHRLSTIQNADCIAVLHRGRVIEHGTHSELMDKKGAYYIMNNNLRI